MSLPTTPSQTVGPFWSIGLDWPGGDSLAGPAASGRRIRLSGRVLDGDGAPVGDGVLELWQADPRGRYAHPEDRRNLPPEPGFTGFGRCGTDAEGGFRFETLRPGPVPAPEGGLQAPHLLIGLFARGLLCRLATRVYFADEVANAADPVLNLVPPERRATLLARPLPGEAGHYVWDVHLQGAAETVFFEY